MTHAIRHRAEIYYSRCEQGASCEIFHLAVHGRNGPRRLIKLDIVSDLTWWRGRLYVAGKLRVRREGLTRAEVLARARWLQGPAGAPLPSGASLPTGYLTAIDPKNGSIRSWMFSEQRPIALASDDEVLYVATEGTPRGKFADGLIFRFTPDGRWEVLVTGLSFPSDLSANAKRLCWLAMPASAFALQCYDMKTRTAGTILEKKSSMFFALADDGTHLYWSHRGLFRMRWP